ncbi:MAG: dihydrolipoyl dehydrogenase [Verrucomicrobiales bacterium]|nr:dihydrolipoyl dehydrogenase [Verrucomicrobiales bacterium]
MEPVKTEVVVVGGGPGGYAAAFYAADLGKKVSLIEMDRLGGVCLNRGCIPSKALLHATKMIAEARESANRGISFGSPTIDLEKLRSWKDSILTKLTGGIGQLAKARGVEVHYGKGYFEDSNTIRVETADGQRYLRYDHAVVAVGSIPALPKAFDLGNPRIMTSTEALEVPDIPARLLVVGGGYIGMELGTVYALLGSEVHVVEAADAMLAGADPDLARPVLLAAQKKFKSMRFKAKVLSMATAGKQIRVVVEHEGKQNEELFDRVLVAVGRRPIDMDLGFENTKVQRDERGFVKVSETLATDDPCIYAIGDIVGGAMLAHKAAKEARVAIQAIMGETAPTREFVVPAVVFTEPELAWCGLTEAEAKAKGLAVEIAKFPWGASGRALTFDRPEGLTKLVIEAGTERILGVGLVGHGAGELIGEGVVAVEMGATVTDLAECVHPHPTLSETLMEAAELYFGHATHAYQRRKAH